ncbi:MAG: hypothetical protein WD159_01090 [Patescibacteria group bacterium]
MDENEILERHLRICPNCGRYYWIEPTGHKWEWRVILATGETVKKIVAAAPTIRQQLESALTGVLETSWYLAEFTPRQIQASVEPLCHLFECVISENGYLKETYAVFLSPSQAS